MTADERMIKRNAPYDLCDIRIRDASDKELEDISSALSLGLSLDEMKAVKEGNCWASGGSMYQRTDIAGDVIMDFHTLFTEEDPESKLQFISKLE